MSNQATSIRRAVNSVITSLLLLSNYVCLSACNRVQTARDSDLENLVTGDVDWTLEANELVEFERRARSGDVRAAETLANHYAALGQVTEQRHWLEFAATRGSCNAMALLQELLAGQGDRSGASHWDAQMRSHQCPGFR